MIKLVISGALGRMGKRITELAEDDPLFEVSAKIEKVPDLKLGIVDNPNAIKSDCDCIIEFTSPEATMAHLKWARKKHMAMVIGTTGLTDDEIKLIKNAAKEIPIVFSPNVSVGVNVLFDLIEKAAKMLGNKYKTSIVETHHIHKKDKPSGTAKLMAKIAKDASGVDEVHTESIREGEVVGDHEITFESDVDVIKISHSAKTRDILAIGALKAAKFIANKKSGLFSMKDVLEK
ncbi:MAG: 4-hydroxy-tetrahydrodipicolinate reductase [Candidatus Omnitrophota bacterium]